MKKILFIVFYFSTIATFAQLEEIKEKLKSKDRSEGTVFWLCDSAYAIHSNDPALAEQVALLALELAKQIGSDLGAAKANHVVGITHWARDNYTESIDYYLEALAYYEKLGNLHGMALIRINVGNVYDDLNQTERSKSYHRSSIKILRELGDSVNLARVLNNLAIAHRRTGHSDSAYSSYQRVMAIKRSLQDSIGVARTFNNISLLFLEKESGVNQEDATIAYNNLISGFEYLKEGDDNRLYATICANLGRAMTLSGQLSGNERYFDKALEIAKEYDFKVIEQWVYMYYAELFVRRKDYQQAFEYFAKEVALDKELRNAEINEQIEELNIKYETVKKEKQIAELERQEAVDRGIRNLLLAGVIAVILIALVLIFYSYQKRKKDKLIAQLQLDKMSEELISKNKEIASYTMSFLQKNQLMEELKDQINELKKNSDITTNKELTRINRIVDNTFRSDEEWKTFQITFDQMHDGFFKDLKKTFPDISNAELKLCALLRLNMNLKESSKILGIAADSVKTARYRLRKKLGLKTEDNLIDFLIQFENPVKTSA
ncbi:tetratricopeptide repeat protein [Ekhidna sp. To15]|uniref:tetratricopeptide repeat protein n=1 Tax=Ekhidna sp. To15 TaxID=3395267 RepID=UPI003F526657